MKGRITETSIAVILLSLTPFSALALRPRKPDCILLCRIDRIASCDKMTALQQFETCSAKKLAVMSAHSQPDRTRGSSLANPHEHTCINRKRARYSEKAEPDQERRESFSSELKNFVPTHTYCAHLEDVVTTFRLNDRAQGCHVQPARRDNIALALFL